MNNNEFDNFLEDPVTESEQAQVQPKKQGKKKSGYNKTSPKQPAPEQPLRIKNNLRGPQALGFSNLLPGEEMSFYESEQTERFMKRVNHGLKTGALKKVR